MPVVSSDSFLHFTGGGLYVLQLILQNGFKLALCDEITGYDNSKGEHIVTAMAIPMICFCDIPPRAVASHAEFYCQNASKPKTEFFGIGMTREWGLKVGLNPVAYTNPSSYSFEINFLEELVYHHLFESYRKNRKVRDTERYDLMRSTAVHQVPVNHKYGVAEFHPRRSFFDKLTRADYYRLNINKVYDANGHIVVRPFRDYIDIKPNHNFYDEREWRYVPHWLEKIDVFQSKYKNDYLAEIVQNQDAVVFNEKFENENFHAYLAEKKWFPELFLKYSFDDISVIVVDNLNAKDELINSLAGFTTFGGFDIDRNVLKSIHKKIKTYDQLKRKRNV